jgi:signal transduction histidine kinase
MGSLGDELTYREARGHALLARKLLGWPIADIEAANKRLETLWAELSPHVQPPRLVSLAQAKEDPPLQALAEQLNQGGREARPIEFLAILSDAADRRYVLAIRGPSGSPLQERTNHVGQVQGFICVSPRQYGHWANLFTVIWIATMAGVLAMLLFQLITQRMFLRPLSQLRRSADKVAKGNIEVRSHIRTGDEFEQLSDTFNSMLARLSDAREQLQAINRSLDVKLEEVSQANITLSEANRLKSEFLANVSHELRTPLNSIIGFAELLAEIAKSQDHERGAKYAENTRNSGRGLLEIINDLLDLAKIEAGKVVMHIDKASASVLCKDLLRLTAPLTDSKNLQVQLEIAQDIPLLETDGGKLQQILHNLLSNAIKFTPSGGQIRIEAEMTSDDSFAVSVMDNGPGISKEDQEHIFDKFTQVDTSATRPHGGAGLGLAIAKELASLLGGEITLTSELGKGSAFTLIIPRILTPATETSPK